MAPRRRCQQGVSPAVGGEAVHHGVQSVIGCVEGRGQGALQILPPPEISLRIAGRLGRAVHGPKAFGRARISCLAPSHTVNLPFGAADEVTDHVLHLPLGTGAGEGQLLRREGVHPGANVGD